MAIYSRLFKRKFLLVGQPSFPTIPTPNIPEVSLGCCSDFVLKVLADDSGEPLQNDRSGFLWWFGQTVTASAIVLQKNVGGVWTMVTSLDGLTTYGTPYDFGFFVNDANESFVGYQLDWSKVLDLHGEGSYRIQCVTLDFTATPAFYYSYEYCLKTYLPVRANGTIRVEYYLNGTLGVNNNDFATKDLGVLNWYNSFRLAGYFTYVESTYTEERVLYNTGERLFVSDEQEPEYRMQLKQQPEFLHDVFRTDVMQADDVYITDYNSRLPINLITKNVYKNSSYSPRWNFLKSKLASVEVKWKQKFNNHKKLRY